MFLPPSVIDADDRGSGHGGATESEEILGGVVEQHGYVERPVRLASGQEQVGPATRLLDELPVGPDLIAEADGRTIPAGRGGGVGPQQRSGVCGRPKGLTGGGGGRRVLW